MDASTELQNLRKDHNLKVINLEKFESERKQIDTDVNFATK